MKYTNKLNQILLLFIFPILTYSQGSYNLTLLGEFEWQNTEGSDIWGWYNPNNGYEYALVGLNDGFSCVDVTNPTNPTEMFYISSKNSTWRDVKTWNNYAYVTTEADTGLLIVDLNDMTGQTHWYVTNFTNPVNGSSTEFTSAHNLYIDENGIAYIFGAGSNSGSNPSDGVIFLDVESNPTNPYYLGEWGDHYIHDGMARGDTLYAGCINIGELYIIDVSDKNNPIVLGNRPTPSNFSHNIWVSDDGNYVFTTDEKSNAFIGSYDITNLSNIIEIDRIQSNPGSNSVPHNTHVDGNFLITSWYRDGTVVHDITYPDNIIQVAYFDSYIGGGNNGPNNGFDGCWGTYPYLPSGNIISSDINSSSSQSGRLLVFRRDFQQACFLKGNVTDLNSSLPLSGVKVEIISPILNFETTNILGDYSTGVPTAGTFDIIFSKACYLSDTITLSMLNGIVTTLDIALEPSFISSSFNGGAIDNSIGNGGFFNGDQHLIFNSYQECIIKSANIYSEGSNTITFELRNNNGNVIDDTTLNILSGLQNIILNFEVPVGNNMQLGVSQGSLYNSGLYRNSTGAIFPYDIGPLITITGTSAQSGSSYYYFYYDIEVDVSCGNATFTSEVLNRDRKLLKTIDILGRENNIKTNNLLIFIYDDGTVERKIITK
ncbi:MAG: hypothetical protein CMP69_05185 [Flavobacteriales bacterium]|nr:hypothetical protein [Flavobacteriales bacterium]